MLLWILRTVSFIFLGYLLYFSQELGRYIIGRSVGVPEGKIKIEMFQFPQRTAIYDGERWILSNREDFLRAYSRYDPFWSSGFMFACSGLFAESVVVAALAILFSLAGWWEVAFAAVVISLGLGLVQIVYSVYISWRSEKIKGDYTIIYVLDAGRAAAYVAAHFILRGILLIFI